MPTKVNNGKEATPNFSEVAAKMTEETKAAVDSMTNAANSATEEVKTLLASNQEVVKQNFATWQEYNQSYAQFVLDATQQTLAQSLAFRESLNKILTDNFKKAQALSLEERELVVDATELFQAQAQAASDYAAKMFTTSSKVMTTTALFSDWAAERVAKMFTSISTN